MTTPKLPPQAQALLWNLLSLQGPWIAMETLTRSLQCPEASVRRSVGQLRKAGYTIALCERDVTFVGYPAGEPVESGDLLVTCVGGGQ